MKAQAEAPKKSKPSNVKAHPKDEREKAHPKDDLKKVQMTSEPKPPFPKQKQSQPGLESEMELKPKYKAPLYKTADKLKGKVAIITGGDSGIGRAVAYLYAREGADVAITYLKVERPDAEEIQKEIKKLGRDCLLIEGDLTDEAFCYDVIDQTVKEFGKLDILVSNAAHQTRKQTFEEMTFQEFDRTFRTNLYAYFHLVKAAVPQMKPGSCIIATASEQAVVLSPKLPDYATTKAAIVGFTKVLAQMLVDKGIRANAVAPGPVWTPLNPADPGQPADKVASFGSENPMKRAAQPEELSPAYVFLASDADSSYVNGEILTVMGGEHTGGF